MTVTHYVDGGADEVVMAGGATRHKITVAGVAMVIETTAPTPASETRYLLKDHLGSTDVVTDASGTVLERMSFDAWGRRRQVNWQAYLASGVPAQVWQGELITKGFTGHEQLDQVELVHMNGRVYDPQLGRFLSADPNIQDLSNLQSFNRYSYVLNNPLSFTDPSAFFFEGLFKAIGRIFSSIFRAIGRVFNAILKSGIFRSIMQIAACANPWAAVTCPAAAAALTLASGGSVIQAFTAAAIAVAQPYIWDEVGDFVSDLKMAAHLSPFETAAASTLSHATVSGALSLAQGGTFLSGFASAGVAQATTLGTESALGRIPGAEGKYLRLAVAAISGGVTSELTGGKFFNGAVTAAFAYLYNDLTHGGRARPLGPPENWGAVAGVGTGIGIATGLRDALYKTWAYVRDALSGVLFNEASGPAPNDGIAAPHGGDEHDTAIDAEIDRVRSLGAENIRKNQVQVDINGNRVGDNRPDLQYDLDGQHYNVEWDYNQNRSDQHGQTIRNNDPNSICVLNKLGC